MDTKGGEVGTSPTPTSTVTATTPTVASTRCHLLQLPPELRNRIWEYAIIKENPINLMPIKYCEEKEEPESGAQPPVTQVCSQIRNEALSMFYACNIFRVHADNLSLDYKSKSKRACEGRFLRALLPQTSKLRHVEVKLCKHESYFKISLDSTNASFTLQTILGHSDDDELEICWTCVMSDGDAARDLLRNALAQPRLAFGLSAEELVKLAA